MSRTYRCWWSDGRKVHRDKTGFWDKKFFKRKTNKRNRRKVNFKSIFDYDFFSFPNYKKGS